MGYFLFPYQASLFFYPISTSFFPLFAGKILQEQHTVAEVFFRLWNLEQGGRQESAAGAADPIDSGINDDQMPFLICLLHIVMTQISDNLEFVLPLKNCAASEYILT